MMVNAACLTLRMVKFTLPAGGIECLITNLPTTQFNTQEICTLYKFRWGIETAFDTLKNKLALENFTGTKPILIERDIYSSIYICNLASDMIADAEAERIASSSAKRNPLKHPVAVNRSYAIGILKDMLISAILAESPRWSYSLDRWFLKRKMRSSLFVPNIITNARMVFSLARMLERV